MIPSYPGSRIRWTLAPVRCSALAVKNGRFVLVFVCMPTCVVWSVYDDAWIHVMKENLTCGHQFFLFVGLSTWKKSVKSSRFASGHNRCFLVGISGPIMFIWLRWHLSCVSTMLCAPDLLHPGHRSSKLSFDAFRSANAGVHSQLSRNVAQNDRSAYVLDPFRLFGTPGTVDVSKRDANGIFGQKLLQHSRLLPMHHNK